MPRALISVSDKTGIVEFATELQKMGWEIISTGGTKKVLRDSGLTVMDISDVTGFPEIMDGRVKTLHPAVHGGLLAVRDNKEHMDKIKELKIETIDLVCVNLYPFEATIAKQDVTLEDTIENIDIGGPTMVRSAAKNYQDVIIVVNPNDYNTVIDQLKTDGTVSKETKEDLCVEAYTHTGRYDSIISNHLRKKIGTKTEVYPESCSLPLDKGQELRYGENPHQKAVFYKAPGEYGLGNIKQLHGKELSFNNYIDLDAAWTIAKEFTEPCAIIIKHTNPCGAAIADTQAEAYTKALASDPVSAFGSIIGLNKEVEKDTAEEMSKLFVEAVVAPSFSKEALEILTQKKNIRLIIMEDFFNKDKAFDYKRVTGGILIQDKDVATLDDAKFEVVTDTKLTPQQEIDLKFAWKIMKHVKSNAILLAKDGATIGVGAGQMSRVDSVLISIRKAGDKVKGAVLASDAFFPFRDSVDTANAAGIKAIIQPGGSMRDQESTDACNENGMSMVHTGMRHFKH